jgi:hypothetical protein
MAPQADGSGRTIVHSRTEAPFAPMYLNEKNTLLPEYEF